MYSIPLHSLIISVGASDEVREKIISSHFLDYEVISAKKISYELVGDSYNHDIRSIVFSEVRKRALIKLLLGQRVVIDAPNLRREDRLGLAQIGIENGVNIFYLICDSTEKDTKEYEYFLSSENEILNNDDCHGISVIDTRKREFRVIDPDLPSLSSLKKTYDGITVVGDIHGDLQSLNSAIVWATSRNHYLIFLGDLIDYGEDSLEVSDTVYNMVMTGKAELILGNHERKIKRWIDKNEVRLSEGNKVTLNSLKKMSEASQKKWIGRFKGLCARASIVRKIQNIHFAHAAIHKNYWNNDALFKELNNYALFGEFEKLDDDNIVKTYNWIKYVPKKTIVFVGHDVRSTDKPFVEKINSSSIVFLDTGCGKGGFLSTADLKFTDDDRLKIQNFNIH